MTLEELLQATQAMVIMSSKILWWYEDQWQVIGTDYHRPYLYRGHDLEAAINALRKEG